MPPMPIPKPAQLRAVKDVPSMTKSDPVEWMAHAKKIARQNAELRV
jgi:hypothetical protein